jgi:hypothetical protein
MEEWKANPTMIHENTWQDDPSMRYTSHPRSPRVLGIVRSDNTFEFTANGYGQGDNMMLTSWSYGYFMRSSRHGGMIYKQRGNDVFHPIFKGMRINCETMQPHKDSEYQVIGRRVDRREAKEYLKGYEDFYKINETMLKAMDYKVFLETAIDVAKSNGVGFDNWCLSSGECEKLEKFALDNMETAPLDSCVAFALIYEINNMYRRAKHVVNGSSYHLVDLELPVTFSNIKRRLNKELYRKNPTVMKPIEYTMGEYYPPSEWGIDILVNGKEVEQY